MQYGQIVFILFILLLLYYAGMIVMDLQRSKAARTAELDNRSEEDIDISDEAKNFKPVQVTRDEPKKKEKVQEERAQPEDTPVDEDVEKPLEDAGDETTPSAGDNDTSPTETNDTVETDDNGKDSPEEAEDNKESEDKEAVENGEEAEFGEDMPLTGDEQSAFDEEPASDEKNKEYLTGQPVRRPGYREPVMTDGIPIEDLIKDVDKLALCCKSDLGAIVFSIETMDQSE